MAQPRTYDTRRSLKRRGRWRIGLVIIIAAGIAGGATALAGMRMPWSPQPDYRDTAQLAQAVKASEQAKGVNAVSADCARLPAGDYACAVGAAGGSIGSYHVRVAPDGRSWAFEG